MVCSDQLAGTGKRWLVMEDGGHHVPDECWKCGGAAVMRQAELEPYWWCPRCCSASVCACDGCLALRAFLWMGG